MRRYLGAFLLLASVGAQGAIPATPVMTLYAFNGPQYMPYYDADSIGRPGVSPRETGTLPQGSSVIPCLVLRDGAPLTDGSGTPYVGFEVVFDPREATPESMERLSRTREKRKSLKVRNHHCPAGVRNVINVRKLAILARPPFFDPPPSGDRQEIKGVDELDRAVRAFHASSECAAAGRSLLGRRTALENAWASFIRNHAEVASPEILSRAKHLDITLRTALFEGHLGRGCNAYGACERNVIALSIRNRAMEDCQARRGCRFDGDFQGVASMVSQYNIWDEYLTQVSGLTSCFLRPDLAERSPYKKLQAMYAQSQPDVERILFGSDVDLREIFPDNAMADIKSLKHYYHAPAMGKCFPDQPRVEYMSGAIARKGSDFALIANTRILVGDKVDDAYAFEEASIESRSDRDVVSFEDDYPGFLVDARKVSLRAPTNCRPFGMPSGCSSVGRGRYRKVPSWLSAGRPLGLRCYLEERGASCDRSPSRTDVVVGGTCDTEMRPVAGVR